MAEQGAELVITGTNQAELAKTAADVKERTGICAKILPCNLAHSEEARELFLNAEDAAGQIDILVNNAGIDKDVLFMKMTEQDLDSVLDVNLRAAFILSQAAVISMSRRRYGRIINMASVVGFTGNKGQVNYCASKAGLVGMSKAIALEYAKRGITVNCIAPGAVQTPMIEALSQQAQDAFLQKIPNGRMATPDDVAYACCYLASREADYVTGQTLHVNGGMFIA
jgi:3-oxoacyl-[acyl-carrier protein] reductase